MAITPVRTVERNILSNKYIALPMVFIEENDLKDKAPLTVMHGKNHSLVIITVPGTKLSERTQERISILVNEPLV